MSVPIIIYTPENLLPFFPQGVIKNVYYQLTENRLKEIQEKETGHRRPSTAVSSKMIYRCTEDILSKKRLPHSYQPIEMDDSQHLFQSMVAYAEKKTVFVRDGIFQQHTPDSKMNVRTMTEYPENDLFFKKLLIAPAADDLPRFSPDIYILHLPGYTPEGIFPKGEIFTIIGNKENTAILSNFQSAVMLKKIISQLI